MAQRFYTAHGHLCVPKAKRGDTSEDSQLAWALSKLRKSVHAELRDRAGQLVRRQLTTQDVAKWECAFPGVWGTARERGQYVPPEHVSGERHIWPREPLLCQPFGCYLCGEDYDSQPQLVDHWASEHITAPQHIAESLGATRVEEEVRKRLFWEEALHGPFEVRGQEHRRTVGAYATNQTQSFPGTGQLHYNREPSATGRQLSGCAVCARSMWLEDLYDMDLFTELSSPKPDGSEGEHDANVGDVQQTNEAPEPSFGCACASGPPRRRGCRFSVHPMCASKVNELLSAEVYSRRWPRIPKHELWASSVQHPYEAGWRWLLHTRRIGDIARDSEGLAPTVRVCYDCGSALSAEDPSKVHMPKYALANDNWIGRMPFDFTPGGELLHDMEVKSLARGRMCVQKVIAEPERSGPRSDRQGGLKGNSIAFPQAKVELRRSSELPPPKEEDARFMSESVIIAMAGVDVQDLHKATWAEVRREPYINAGTFLTRHNMFYGDMQVNAERAAEAFAERGKTSDAILQQAVPIEVSDELRCRLEGPADTGVAGVHAGVHDERVVAVDGELVISESEDELDVGAAIPDAEHPEAALPAMHVCADTLTSGDLDELQAVRKVHAELEKLQEQARADAASDARSGVSKLRVRALQQSTKALLDGSFADAVLRKGREIETMEAVGIKRCLAGEAGYVQGTASRPMSMYGPEQWGMCFPLLFPYGDGVFGLARRNRLTFQQCASMHLLREELSYQVTPENVQEASRWARNEETDAAIESPAPCFVSRCSCAQCSGACEHFTPPSQPRWGADREMLCCCYDSWRRMEQIRKARGHVLRPGFHERLERVCGSSAEKIDAAIVSLGDGASIKDVMRSADVDPDVKAALSELMVFTADVCGSDGARAKLRHEQNGYALMFGAAGGFLTPNVADTRSPLVVHIHGAGGEEKYFVDLLEEEPEVPCARDMLRIIAKDPVAQARFFILSMRLFCEHVLGTGPFDAFLRHNGRVEGPAFPDGFAASGLGGAFAMLAACHGPIEEQARLSIHAHILMWFVHAQSEQWLRSLLRRETEQARSSLRLWQEKVLAAVQSMQLDSAAVLPLLLTDSPEDMPLPENTPFSEQQQAECRMDGKLEGDVREPEKRRVWLATAPLFEDHHVHRHRRSLLAGAQPLPDYLIPQTGAQLCMLPHYRLLQPCTDDDLQDQEGRLKEAAAWRGLYARHYRGNIAVGQMHAHKDTCFKYVVDKGMKIAKHCRFHFNHFVRLFLPGASADGKPKPAREVVFARTGKDLVLPSDPTAIAGPNLYPVGDDGELIPLRPTRQLGPSVVTDPDHGKEGLVVPIRWNPLEGSSNGPAQVSICGNCDYQNMMRTLCDGFNKDLPDKLRDLRIGGGAALAQEDEEETAFEANLGKKVAAAMQQRLRKGMEEKSAEDIEEELRNAREKRKAAERRGTTVQRFARWMRRTVVDGLKSSLQAMFYACDYSTKPNMTCAPLMVAVRDGIHKLEETMRQEEEDAKAEAAPVTAKATALGRRPLTKLEDDARRRLIRQATAANQAIVKGNCLMVTQILTGREVLRTHFPWQLMLKNAMWMAFQHRRELQGFDEREPREDVLLNAALADPSDQEESVSVAGESVSSESELSDASDKPLQMTTTEATGLCPPRLGGIHVEPPKEIMEASQKAGSGEPATSQLKKARLRLQTNSYYDDYLHRGLVEPGPHDCLVETPLCKMSYYTYAMWVRVVEGDPDDLATNQYAFAPHHGKYENYVQELRAAPVVPYLHGFTMPTSEKDAETNACFKQVVLRPHRCCDSTECRGVAFTTSFCEALAKGAEYSYVPCWRRYLAEQRTLAERADVKLHAARMWPVLQDVTSLRQWWLPGAVRDGFVHGMLLPLLCGHAAHSFDSSLKGAWARRREWSGSSGGKCGKETKEHMEAWRRQRQESLSCAPCFRIRLPQEVAWRVLLFAGYVVSDDGGIMGIAATDFQLARLQEQLGSNVVFAYTSPGFHELQLTAEQFHALRHVEVAARLEYMAEARGRPRPGQMHPDAEQDDPDCAQGGDRDDTDAEFEEDEKMPGGDGDAEDAAPDGRADPDFCYKPIWAVQEDEMENVVHRKDEAQRHARSKQYTPKKELMATFLRDHLKAYASISRRRRAAQRSPNFNDHSPHELQQAMANQKTLVEVRKGEDSRPAPSPSSTHAASPQEAVSRPLVAEDLPRSPIDVATELIATSGVWRSREQYLATLFMLQPCQQLWEAAMRDGSLATLQSNSTLAWLSKGIRVRRLFLHGPGGSGKTYCLTEVVMKVVAAFFGKRGVLAIAAANSAARLLRGKTMHAAGKLTRQQSLKARNLKPNSRAKRALQREWECLVLLLGDELSMASPPLLAGISRRASHGRKDLLKLDVADILDQPFGEVPLQALSGDFMQLNPVKSHTLMEALLRKSYVPGVPSKVKDEDEDGYTIFRKVCENVVLFTGSHRFLDQDLPRLLEIMRTKGGAVVPEDLRQKITRRIVSGPADPRLDPAYALEGCVGFFAFGASAAIQWEQVARMQQLQVLISARYCLGPVARMNKDDGSPDSAKHGLAKKTAGVDGQLVYYFQAVDRFRHHQPRELYIDALKFVNLSKSAGLLGMFSGFLGMRVRLKKKVLPPELVQEATGEIVGICFHPKERFGHPDSSNLRPAESHECWQRGWVICDFLPLYVEVRFDGLVEDYTGLGKPGVWHVEPTTDEWRLPVNKSFTVDHPNAPRAKRVQVKAKRKTEIDVSRTQVPLAPEFPVTFQGIQGTTVRGPENQPKGLTLDLYRPQTMQGEEREPEYFQHLYMGLGRAQKLEWMLLWNFPRDEQGDLDWSIFEKGPPDFLVEFLEALEQRARRTWPKLERAQRELGMPAWTDVPKCAPDPAKTGRFLYNPVAWGKQATKSLQQRPCKRVNAKRPPMISVSLKVGDPALECASKKQRKESCVIPEPAEGALIASLPSSAGAPGLRPMAPRGWWCPLLHKRIGAPLPRPNPPWFNDPACGAVRNGTQVGLTCGIFAVNHCLARHGLPLTPLQDFRLRAGDGCYPEGDFDDCGMQRNLEARGCFFEQMQGSDYEEAVRQLNSEGLLGIFHGSHALGCIIHMPNPRHWFALVPPVQQLQVEVAALLCDSLRPQIYSLSVDDMVDLFTTMGLRHAQYADLALPTQVREELAAGWSAYKVTC